MAIAGVVAAQSMIFGLAINLSPPSGTARMVLHGALALSAVAVFALAGMPLVRSSWRAACAGRIVFDQLFLAGVLAAFAASVHCTFTGIGHVYYEIVAILLAIYTFGGLITDSRRREALDAAGDLGSEFSRCGVLHSCGSVEEKDVAEVAAGELTVVGPGQPVCVDGTVEEGTAFVREAALTGEPFPVVKRTGDFVRAGSYSVDGRLVIRAVTAGDSRTLDGLLRSLREARTRPSRLQREADRLASWFLPGVLVVASATFAFWTWRAGWSHGLFNALAVVLVACPCAMGIATPVAIWSALAAFARRGLITRDPDLVEKLAGIDTAVFDKTGTLAEETMFVVDFVAAEGFDRDELRSAVASLEAASDHPVARAFRGNNEKNLPASEIRILPGSGISGIVAGWNLEIGNHSVVPDRLRSEALALAQSSNAMRESATHAVYVVSDGRLAGVAVLRESLREGVLEILARLDSMGIRCEVMTGDRAEAAALHHLPNVRADLLPGEKVDPVRSLQAAGRRVLFVGDGINDSAALAAADAAIAIRSGAPIARESADAELAGSDLDSIAGAITKARDSVRAIRGNLRFAACYNLLGIGLAAAGFLHPVAAALIMLASSFTVTTRALRSAGVETRKPEVQAHRRHGAWIGPVAALALFLQGIALCRLGAFHGATAAGLALLFAAGGLVLYWLCTLNPMTPEGRVAVFMFSFGGLAMLGGWWADAGFAPVVRDGVCLCNCPGSTLGLGLLGGINWMDAGMLAASVPMFFVAGGSAPRSRWLCWLAGLGGMLLGMRAATWLASFLPAQMPQVNFFAGYGVMLFGMILGMILACGAARRIPR